MMANPEEVPRRRFRRGGRGRGRGGRYNGTPETRTSETQTQVAAEGQKASVPIGCFNLQIFQINTVLANFFCQELEHWTSNLSKSLLANAFACAFQPEASAEPTNEIAEVEEEQHEAQTEV
ncbi:hypothetical protein Hamer_G001801, partial [Homarus americanus]